MVNIGDIFVVSNVDKDEYCVMIVIKSYVVYMINLIGYVSVSMMLIKVVIFLLFLKFS